MATYYVSILYPVSSNNLVPISLTKKALKTSLPLVKTGFFVVLQKNALQICWAFVRLDDISRHIWRLFNIWPTREITGCLYHLLTNFFIKIMLGISVILANVYKIHLLAHFYYQ